MAVNKPKRVAIIGAGTCGLVATKCCLDEGLEPVCFERTSDIGGLWCYREDSDFTGFSTTTVYKSTVTNVSKEFMAFSDFPMPKNFPNYLPSAKYLEYLNLYVDRFNLRSHLVFDTCVKLVSKADDYDTTGRWKLELENTDGFEIFDAVLVCNGRNVTPIMPELQGLDDFQGMVLHSKDYKKPTGYDDKRVLVIGIGNSGCDVAAELAKVTKQLYLSTRAGGAWMLPRLHEGGLPIDHAVIRRYADFAPTFLRAWLVQRAISIRFDHSMYGLKPKHDIFSSTITVNDEIQFQIANGKVVIKPDIKRFTKSGVEFTDGTSEDIDCVILATGFDITFPIDQSVTSAENCQINLYRFMFPPDLPHPTLAILGLTTQAGPINHIAELQSRWVASLINGSDKMPTQDDMLWDIERRKQYQKNHYREATTRSAKCDFIPYMDEIACEIGAKPDLWKMLFDDPMLSLRCFFGPCYPYQYRLVGAHKWHGAKEAIETAWDKISGAYQTRQVPKDNAMSSPFKTFIILAIAGVIISCIYAI